MWCIEEINDEYRKRMYTILKLYFEDYDPKYPIICFDEKHKHLTSDLRMKIPMRPGISEKYDYSYKRRGSANIFVAVDFNGGKRDIMVTDRELKEILQFILNI
ncbi:MAG: hypothetical protein LBB45_00390 [Methanobrevibacter sp.]|nr:hypothetical protein [Candidatus Methanovirga basalitermitum]